MNANLLTIRFSSDRQEVLYPWQQHPAYRIDLDLHTQTCKFCQHTTLSLFDTAQQRDLFEPRCVPGAQLAETLCVLRDDWRGWREQAS